MSMEHGELTLRAFRDPQSVLDFSDQQWDLLVRQAREARLLASLCVLLQKQELLERVPPAPRHHLQSTLVAAQALARSVRWEIRCLCKALAGMEIPLLLLKGAAYCAADLAPNQGRIYQDVDIMVPKDKLERVEQHLLVAGWYSTHMNTYDQRYYRQWMHELPPMRHLERRSALDVHHRILPETASLQPDPVTMFDHAVNISNGDTVQVLSPQDMVLHSATHLFHDGELEQGLRDLLDLDGLLRQFSAQAGFWQQLVPRAKQLELTRPLYYALRFTKRMLQTPVPDEVTQEAQCGQPGFVVAKLMDLLFAHALLPDHPSCRTSLTGLYRWMLYVRSHYLRMPLVLLIPHLIRKAFRAKEH